MSGLYAALGLSPWRTSEKGRNVLAAAAAVIGFVLVWTVFHAVSHNTHAINDDTAEAYVWGQQFEWGYWKHPPFWAWIAGAWFDVFPRNGWFVALLASCNAAVGLIGAWRLNGCFVRGQQRTAATVLLLLTPLYTLLGFKYNANSIFVSLWPWTAFFFMRSIERRSVGYSALFGVMAGFDMLSKYYAVLLLVTCFCAALAHPARERYFRSLLPWIAMAIAAVLFAPHLVWLAHNDYTTLHYFNHETGNSFVFVGLQFINLICECIGYNLLVVILVMAVTRTTPRDWMARFKALRHDAYFRVLLILALLPAVLTLLCSVLFRVTISSNTMIGVFCLTPVVFLELARPSDAGKVFRASVLSAAVIAVLALFAAPAMGAHGVRDLAIHEYVARRIDSLWKQNTSAPLAYVTGAEPFAEELAFYLPERPREFIRYSFADAPWVTAADLARDGFAAVCVAGDARCLAQARAFAPGRVVQQTLPPLRHLGSGKKAREALVLIVAPPSLKSPPGKPS